MPSFLCFRWASRSRHKRPGTTTLLLSCQLSADSTSQNSLGAANLSLPVRPKTHPDKPVSSNRFKCSLKDADAHLPVNPQERIVPDEPERKFTLFPKLPAELRLKIWSLVPPPTRVISIKRSPLRILANKPIPTRATCSESRAIISQNLVFFKGVCIDLEKDAFILPCSKTVSALLHHWPELAYQIRSLALEPFGFFERKFARYKILDIVRSMGNLEELILCLNRKEELLQSSGELRIFLELERATDGMWDVEDDKWRRWNVPAISSLLARKSLSLSFADEVMEWLEKTGG